LALRSLFLAAALTISAIPAARAQLLLDVSPVAKKGGAAGYVGPGDIFPGAVTWIGLRAYSNAAALAQVLAIRLREKAGNTEADIRVLATGDLDVATATTFCTGTTCLVAVFYDQTGNNNNFIAVHDDTIIYDMNFEFSCLGGMITHACIYSPGAGTAAITAGVLVAGSTSTMAAVANRLFLTGGYSALMASEEHSGQEFFGWDITANTAIFGGDSSGGLGATAADNTWHSMVGVVNGASSFLTIDGVDTPGSTTGTINQKLVLFATLSGGNNTFGGRFVEGGMWASAPSNSARAAFSTNARAFWGY
jgi:hypothetical protein